MIIRLILVTLFLLECRANDCFGQCKIVYEGEFNQDTWYEGLLAEGSFNDHHPNDDLDRLPVTNYHCIMKCAHKLTKATMGLALDDLYEKFNAHCIMIENLDYCVQYWRQWNDVDCEEPIKNMVKQNFQVSST